MQVSGERLRGACSDDESDRRREWQRIRGAPKVQEAACARTGVYMAARARVHSGEGWRSGVVVPKTARLTLAYCTRGSSSSCTVTLQQSRLARNVHDALRGYASKFVRVRLRAFYEDSMWG